MLYFPSLFSLLPYLCNASWLCRALGVWAVSPGHLVADISLAPPWGWGKDPRSSTHYTATLYDNITRIIRLKRYYTILHYNITRIISCLGPECKIKYHLLQPAASSQEPANNNQQQVGGWVSKWLSGWHCMMQYMGEWHYMLCCAAWCYIIFMVDARGRHPDYVLLLPFVLLVFMLCCVMLYYVMLLCIMLYYIMVCYNG